MSSRQSPIKKALIGFIKTPMETEYAFRIEGGDAVSADKFVKAMRVELSRLRNYVESKGKTPKPFKMLLLDIVADETGVEITLKKSGAGLVRAMGVVDELFDHLALNGDE